MLFVHTAHFISDYIILHTTVPGSLSLHLTYHNKNALLSLWIMYYTRILFSVCQYGVDPFIKMRTFPQHHIYSDFLGQYRSVFNFGIIRNQRQYSFRRSGFRRVVDMLLSYFFYRISFLTHLILFPFLYRLSFSQVAYY